MLRDIQMLKPFLVLCVLFFLYARVEAGDDVDGPEVDVAPEDEWGKVWTLDEDSFEVKCKKQNDQPNKHCVVGFGEGPFRKKTKFGQAMQQASKDSKGLYRVAYIDCEEDREVCLDFNVKSYPTVVYVANGNVAKSHKYKANDFVDRQKLTSFIRRAQIHHQYEDESLEDGSGNPQMANILQQLQQDKDVAEALAKKNREKQKKRQANKLAMLKHLERENLMDEL